MATEKQQRDSQVKRQLQLQLNLVSVQLLQRLVTLQAPGDVE